ncbi:hypothetical protein J6590_098797 [Homalodisca vitripennis]|nr:hypothetical protein J6590_098797 [Homalodisca vitripennis]
MHRRPSFTASANETRMSKVDAVEELKTPERIKGFSNPTETEKCVECKAEYLPECYRIRTGTK